MAKLYNSLLIIFLTVTSVFAGNSLQILNPQAWWSNDGGTIEEAVISVKPQGTYTEYGLYLTLSARGTYFSDEEQLEVEFNFNLPENAIVIDSWLWIEGEIVQGIIMDKWTASSIYEEIVNRQRDPSILFKQSATQYQLRVYPLFKNTPRKIKITYLVPTEWDQKSVRTSLPLNLLKTSRFPLEELNILTNASEEWKNPKVTEKPDVTFSAVEDSVHLGYMKGVVPLDGNENKLTVSYDTMLKDNVFLSVYEDTDESYYQLALLPPGNAESLGRSRNLLFLVDYAQYQSYTNSVKKDDILTNLKTFIETYLTEKDSFNIFLSNIDIKKASDVWLQSDSSNIDSVFTNFAVEENISNYSNLVSLLNEGVKFLNLNNSNSQIVLVSNSREYGEFSTANDIIKDLIDIFDPVKPINIIDAHEHYYSYWFNGRTYNGNEYLFENLSRLTKGEHYSIREDNSLELMFEKLSNALEIKYNSLDIHTKLQNGFCYSRFSNNLGVSTSINDAILQVGKFKGEFPFIVEASGLYDTSFFYQQYEIQKEDIFDTDSASKLIWTGKMIQSLENSEETNSNINEIIFHSTKERILSEYTAFICLEPDRGGEVCYDCFDETEVIISVEDEEGEDDSVFTAYPNPFNMETQIVVKLRKHFDMSDLSFKIYNILGEQVKSFTADNNPDNRLFKFTWNGKNDYGQTVSSGVYLFTVTSASDRQTLKLLLMK